MTFARNACLAVRLTKLKLVQEVNVIYCFPRSEMLMELLISCITCTINTETSGKSEVSESLDVTL